MKKKSNPFLIVHLSYHHKDLLAGIVREMEAVVAERLRHISAQRREFLAAIDSRMSLSFLEKNWVFHSVLFFCSASIILGVFRVIRNLTIFSFHPLCMTIGSFLLLGEGMASYRNHSLLEALSPIMQHNKRMKVRAIHQAAQMTGVLFLVIGMGFIIVHKQEIQHSIWPKSIHSFVAIFTMLCIVLQVISGQEKFHHYLNQVEHHQSISSQVKIRKWHGDLGLLIWDLLCLTMFLGLLAFLPWSFTSLLLLCMPWLVWMVVVLQVHGKFIRGEVFRELHEEFERSQQPSTASNNNSGLNNSSSHGRNNQDNDISTSESEMNRSCHGFDDSRHQQGRVSSSTGRTESRKSGKSKQRLRTGIEEDVDYDPEEAILYQQEDGDDEEEEEEEETEESRFIPSGKSRHHLV